MNNDDLLNISLLFRDIGRFMGHDAGRLFSTDEYQQMDVAFTSVLRILETKLPPDHPRLAKRPHETKQS